MRNDELLAENKKLRERISGLEQVLEDIPAAVYINQLGVPGRIETGVNIWSNKYALEYIGYTAEEIREMKHEYFSAIIHPDDLKEMEHSVKHLDGVPRGGVFTGIMRLKPKGSDYRWILSHTRVLSYNDDGAPVTFLNVGIELDKLTHSEKQLGDVLKSISQVENRSRLHVLSAREREILKLIASGHTDEEISQRLNISSSTTHTHRHNIIKKTGLKNVAMLVAFAIECGLG